MEAGVDMIQIREKDLSGRSLEEIARRAVAMSKDAKLPTQILVNDRLDVALAAGAAGVHLPAAGLPVRTVRAVTGSSRPDLLVGVSTHSREEARAVAAAGADYLIFGPIFETSSKPGHPGLGVSALAEVSEVVDVPVFAIGGMDPERVESVARSGAAGIAGISAFCHADSTRRLMAALRHRGMA
jgi:thiamine-phosphate pyrophosphorylase